MIVNKIDIPYGENKKMVIVTDDASSEEEYRYDISLAEHSSCHLTIISLAGSHTSYDIHVSLDGKQADCTINGLYQICGEESVRFNVEVIHNVPECRSSQLFKGILKDRAHSEFEGLIKVVPQAQKTEAYQANHNLLLSTEARAGSKPQLEIYADDVKCSHGATIGQLNEDELFYMRSRGISFEEARRLQIEAFASEVIPEGMRDEILQRL